MAWRELPRKQTAKSSTNRALKISGGIWRGKSLILRPKQVTANTPPVGTPSSVPNSSDKVTPTRTLNLRSLKYSETKMGSLPLNPALCKSRMIPYCQVVSYAFSRSKKRPTACCLWAKASRTYLSRLTKWSVVHLCFLKQHWLLLRIPFFSRYQIKRWLIILSKILHRQLVSAMGLELSGSEWSLPGLGMGITEAALHWAGKRPDIHIPLRISFKTISDSSGRCFRRTLWMPSGPGALGLAFRIARLRSRSLKRLLYTSVFWDSKLRFSFSASSLIWRNSCE